jgi:opacity protein-like surface antigen
MADRRFRCSIALKSQSGLMRTAIAIVIATAIFGSAMAADVPVKAPAYARRAAPPPYNWSGFYLGANLGGAWSNRTLNVAGTA